MKFKHITKPGWIGNMKLKNRMILPPMDTRSALADGTVSETNVNWYYERAKGGAALVSTEIVNPSPGLKGQPGEIEGSSDKFMPGLSRIASAIHAGGAKAAMQICHCGIFARPIVTEKQAMSPSGIGTFHVDQIPKAMSKEDIVEAVEDFGLTAVRARQAGFDAVNIHGAHGYLLVEFLSGYYNRRTDEYGGSLENKMRIALEVVQSVQKHAGKDFPIIYRMSAEDYTPNGITIEESIEFAKALEAEGVAAIDVSSGTLESRWDEYKDVMDGKISAEGLNLSHGVSSSTFSSSYLAPRGINMPYAKAIKEQVGIPIIIVNSVLPEMAEEAISNGEADFVDFGRQMIADPELPNKIIQGKSEDIRPCVRCNDCLESIMLWRVVSCSVNPEAGIENTPMSELKPAVVKKKIAVIGGGPGGLQAAITLKERGHEPILLEKEDKLGGQLNDLEIPGFQRDFRPYTKYLLRQITKLNIEVRLNCEFTVEMAKAEHFDHYIVGTGSTVFVPDIPGARANSLIDPIDVIHGNIPEGDSFIVCGAGLTGCEVAMVLAEAGKKVTVIDVMPDIAIVMIEYLRWVQKARLAELGVVTKPRHKIVEIGEKSVRCIAGRDTPDMSYLDIKLYNIEIENMEGEEITFNADSVICALGMKPNTGLADELQDAGFAITVIGDANSPRKIYHAVHEGYHAARVI